MPAIEHVSGLLKAAGRSEQCRHANVNELGVVRVLQFTDQNIEVGAPLSKRDRARHNQLADRVRDGWNLRHRGDFKQQFGAIRPLVLILVLVV